MRTNGVRVEGLETTLSELNREVGKIKDRTMAGLLAGGLHVQRESQKKTPHRLGDLVRSAYTRKETGGSLAVEVGYGSAYALFVHEMQMVNAGEPRPAPYPGVLWGPDGEPKFLENALSRSSRKVLDLVAAYAGRGLK